MFKNKNEFKKEYERRLVESYGCAVEDTHPTEKYLTLGRMVRDYANVNWKDTKNSLKQSGAKQVYYFSIEFLLGRMLTNNLKNLGIYDIVVQGLKEMGIDYQEIADLELDPGLGNGGLGRLAACFMDSSASLNYPVNGNCIRYKAGLFKQYIDNDGNQVEVPDYWLKYGNPWEIRKPKHVVEVPFYGNVECHYDEYGNPHFLHENATKVVAVPYDMAMIGADTKMTNTLRLWSAEPSDEPSNMAKRDYLSMVSEICLNLYPDDSTDEGKYLRLMQEYFMVCAGINSIIRSHLKQYPSLENLGRKVAIQLNDTHPVLCIPELMRVLIDEYGFGWEDAWEVTKETVSYTNHTVMAEALEKWPVRIVATLLPRIYMIIQEIDRRFNLFINDWTHGDSSMVDRMRIIREDQVHMANLAIVGSHSVNGVAEIHSEILKHDLFNDFYTVWPEKFSNKTNGITPRRWMMYSDPQLKDLIDRQIGTAWEKDWTKLETFMDSVDDPKVQKDFLAIKQSNKERLAAYIYSTTGVRVDPASIFDSQAKRLHAYKRQLLNIMNVIYRYQCIKQNPDYQMTPHTYLFAAKAASSYTFAKNVIKLINRVAMVVNNDPDVRGRIKVVFLPNYNVTMAEVLVPGTEVSEQISTAGKEASGTGCMKFMMNGAVTIGTLDGANVEIDRRIGRENDIIFGHTVEELEQMRYTYDAHAYYNNDERIRNVMNTFTDTTWSEDPNEFRSIFDELMYKNDEFFVLADFDAYVKAQDRIDELYADRSHWAKMCLINIAQSGFFSSDRTIDQYAREIWKIEPQKI
jgi:starch phosphorylase